MGICQIIFTGWMFLEIGYAIAKNGQRRDGYHCWWSTCIAYAILALLLWGGGFYG